MFIIEVIRAVLVPFLAILAALLFVLTCVVIMLHAVRDARIRRTGKLRAAYRPLIDDALQHGETSARLGELRASPRSHRPVIESLILEPLRVAEGALTEQGAAVASALGLVDQWQVDLRHRRWWVRAEAARALGLVRWCPAVTPLIAALDDSHEEVRAAAVDALGLIAHPVAIPELIERFRDPSRHQRVRVVQALRQFGSGLVSPLVTYASQHSEDVPSAADLLGSAGAPEALDALVVWCRHERPEARTAAVRAIGNIGVDERAFYHILRALNDESADVRAAAAWALGRSGRPEAASYLATRLGDQWIVAAESARALARLGPMGRRELEGAAARPDGELARQALWEGSGAYA